jgi:hypothetical protein
VGQPKKSVWQNKKKWIRHEIRPRRQDWSIRCFARFRLCASVLEDFIQGIEERNARLSLQKRRTSGQAND